MKKIVFTKVFLILYLTMSYSQEMKMEKWKFGIHGGAVAGKMLWANKVDDNPNFFIQYPETAFRLSYCFGISALYQLNNKFYIPTSLDLISRKFAIGTGGVVQAQDNNGQWIKIRADYIDYKINNLSLASGIGYRFLEQLSLEIQPYFQLAISDQKAKVGSVIDWRKDETFQQNFDFGIGGNLRFDFNKFYVKAGYQYGIREITEYSAFDANGNPLGKFPIRNTLILLQSGYCF